MSLTTPSRSTLADVLAAIETAGLAERRRQDMTSAVRTVVKALGHPADRIGPMIINENTGLPYTANTYRTTWRIIADAAQLPPETQNRDSRSGSITEATDADTGLELTRTQAGHRNASMTARYSKNTRKKTTEVALLRIAARGEK